MLGRLEPGKFPRRLLAFLPDLRATGARLLVAGSGGRRFEIEPEVARRGLADVVQFVGPLPLDRVPGFLAGADVGLHLTEVHDEVGGFTVKAMLAAGLPVVAEPSGCLPEIVVSGRNGFLARGEREVADRLTELVRSPALRGRMGRASRRMARRHDVRLFGASLRALVRRLTSNREPNRGARDAARRWRSRRRALALPTRSWSGLTTRVVDRQCPPTDGLQTPPATSQLPRQGMQHVDRVADVEPLSLPSWRCGPWTHDDPGLIVVRLDGSDRVGRRLRRTRHIRYHATVRAAEARSPSGRRST